MEEAALFNTFRLSRQTSSINHTVHEWYMWYAKTLGLQRPQNITSYVDSLRVFECIRQIYLNRRFRIPGDNVPSQLFTTLCVCKLGLL